MNKRKILLADDSASYRKVIELTLASEGMDVTAVADGDAAMSAFVSDQPDVVIADVHMTGASGLQICEMIKQDESTSSIPVILLVGSYEPFDPQRAVSVGADFYFTKPFASIRQLVDKVKDLIGERLFHEEPRPDTDDIEGLYKQSFSNAAAEPIEQTVAELGYVGMDDLRDEPDEEALLSLTPDEQEMPEIGALRSESLVGEEPKVGFSLDESSSLDDEMIEVTQHYDEAVHDPVEQPATAEPALLKLKFDEGATEDTPVLTKENISSELMDEIVRRVVEKMSDAVIRDVAAETVPRITKNLLREALDKDRDLTQ